MHHDEDLDSLSDAEVEVTCPYCGEVVAITLDPDGGASQEYVQDCEVCVVLQVCGSTAGR
jgi:hypothetical protein